MSDLKQVFLKVHQLYTGTSRDLHSTRMKEKLIIKSPGLPAHRRGKQVILTTGEVTREAVLAALSYSDDDGKDLVQAAKRICQIRNTNLNSVLIRILKKNSVPMSLIMLLQTILGGQAFHFYMMIKHET